MTKLVYDPTADRQQKTKPQKKPETKPPVESKPASEKPIETKTETPKPSETKPPTETKAETPKIFEVKSHTDGDFRFPKQLLEQMGFGAHAKLSVEILPPLEKGKTATLKIMKV